MRSFLAQCVGVTRFDYMWNISILERSVMLSDVSRADYKKKKKKTEETGEKEDVKEDVKQGLLSDFLSGK